MTPYEAWTMEKPTVAHLRVFGSDVWCIHIFRKTREESSTRKHFRGLWGTLRRFSCVQQRRVWEVRGVRRRSLRRSGDDCPTAQEPNQKRTRSTNRFCTRRVYIASTSSSSINTTETSTRLLFLFHSLVGYRASALMLMSAISTSGSADR